VVWIKLKITNNKEKSNYFFKKIVYNDSRRESIMKKILALLLFTFLLTGCFGGGEEVISCERVDDISGFEIAVTNDTVIKNGQLYSDEVVMTTTPDAAMIDHLEEYVRIIDEQFANLAEARGITYTSVIEDGVHILTIKVIYAELDEDEIANFNAAEREMLNDRDETNISAIATKELRENEGFTCEIR